MRGLQRYRHRGGAPSSTALQVFNFKGNEVRTILGEDGGPWWVASEICRVLEISESHVALRRLDDDEKGRCTVPTLGGDQEVSIINESGLYSLILTSRKPEAKAFKKWVTSEVLPAIRKTGRYEAPGVPHAPSSSHAFEATLIQMNARFEARLCEIEARLEAPRSLEYREDLPLRQIPKGMARVADWAWAKGVKLSEQGAIEAGIACTRLHRKYFGPKSRPPKHVKSDFDKYPANLYQEWILDIWLELYKRDHPEIRERVFKFAE